MFYAVYGPGVHLSAVSILFRAINSSLKTENQLQMTPATFVPRNPATDDVAFSWRNYQGVFQNEDFGRGLINSTVVALSYNSPVFWWLVHLRLLLWASCALRVKHRHFT